MPFQRLSVSEKVGSMCQVGNRDLMYVAFPRWSQVCVLMPSLIYSLIVGTKLSKPKPLKVRFAVLRQRVKGDT